jgi:hypothetical protein
VPTAATTQATVRGLRLRAMPGLVCARVTASFVAETARLLSLNVRRCRRVDSELTGGADDSCLGLLTGAAHSPEGSVGCGDGKACLSDLSLRRAS